MSTPDSSQGNEAAEMASVMERPLTGRLKAYTSKCGPGWLQGAITLGGGSLAGSLYLGIIAGYAFMWLQPIAMVMGVIMLSAISYVTLSTGRRPFGAINEHVSPLLGWGWLIATLMANIVWCLPQFALGSAAIQQNLIPGLNNPDSNVDEFGIAIVLLIVASGVIWLYDSPGKGVKIFENILKVMVGIVVLSFLGVVLAMANNLPWGEIFSGLIPDFSLFSSPAPLYEEAISQTGSSADFWRSYVVGQQKSKMIAAFATAVGINMTFLLPYSMLKKGWGKNHRGLAIFDLSTGLIIPYVLATACVVIAAASQFHGKSDDVFVDGQINPKMVGQYYSVADKRLAKDNAGFAALDAAEKQTLRDQLPESDKRMAAMLAERDSINLANALKPLTGPLFAQIIFGVGVLGMALSTIIILMLISGFTFCEMLNVPSEGMTHRIGCLIPGVIGIFFPIIWAGQSKAALAVPTSVIGGALLPIAYFTFLLLMNSKRLLGDAMPKGTSRIIWNVLMVTATVIATFASVWGLINRTMAIGGSQ
ncbi:MAG: divalent metal cation transporter, partial [Verrucomicrobiales bacterium]